MQSKEMPLRRKSQRVIFFVGSALAAALALGLAVLLWNRVNKYDQNLTQSRHSSDISDRALSPIAIAIPQGQVKWTVATIKGAMATCDVEAARNPNSLYFLVTAVDPATLQAAAPILPPSGDNYGSFHLIQSPSLFRGLEDGSLELSTRPYEFSVLDINTANAKRWTLANGPSKFTDHKASEILEFKIGFDFEGKNLTWTNTYNRQKGVCYWVNLRFNGQFYLPFLGRVDLGTTKSFPSPAATLRCANHVCEGLGNNPP